MSGISALQRHIEDKARALLDGYLPSVLAPVAIPGVSDRIGALRVAVGFDPSQFAGSTITDTLPRVDFYCISAETEYDITGTQMDVLFTYEVSGVTQYDESDFSAAARSSQMLCGYACETLEQYLRDKAGASGCIWRVDTTSPVQTQTQVYDIGETRLHTMQSLGEMTVYARATFADTATFLDPTIEPGNPTIFDQLADIASGLDADSGLGTATANRTSTWTTTPAALAAATDVDVDLLPAFAWASGASATIYMQRHGATVTTDPSAGSLTVTLATYSVVDGDRWIIYAADDGANGTRHHATWAINWSVSE